MDGFTFHLVNLKLCTNLKRIGGVKKFTFHLVNLKPPSKKMYKAASEVFTFHLVNLKRRSLIFSALHALDLHST
ncbi:TPA: hypothetical protein KOG56_000735 [Clostridioides difficile]|nr:hypothetical protein [Clostridioides difficile]